MRKKSGKLTVITIAWTLFFCGCSGQEQDPIVAIDRSTGEEIELTGEIREALRQTSEQQSVGLTDASVRVHRAYNYDNSDGRFEVDLENEWKIIAMDAGFTNFNSGFDLDDIDIIDAATDLNYGSDPHIEGIVGDGVLADIDDPEVWLTENYVRVLLVYIVPKTCQKVRLGYWGDVLTAEPVDLDGFGPQVPKSSIESCLLYSGTEVRPGVSRFFCLVTGRDWYRSRFPKYSSLLSNEGHAAFLARAVELGESLDPIEGAMESRPPLIEERRFLIEFWESQDLKPLKLEDFVNTCELQAGSGDPPARALAALRMVELSGRAEIEMEDWQD